MCYSINLSHFTPLVSFYTPWKHQKTFCFQGCRKTTGMVWVKRNGSVMVSYLLMLRLLKLETFFLIKELDINVIDLQCDVTNIENPIKRANWEIERSSQHRKEKWNILVVITSVLSTWFLKVLFLRRLYFDKIKRKRLFVNEIQFYH